MLFGLAFTWTHAQEVSGVKAIQNKNIITLMWTVSNEPAAYCCYVEISTDGKHFEPIGKVKGRQSYMDKQYFYQVKGFSQQKLWFRIKKVSITKQTSYSKAVFLKPVLSNEITQVYTEVVD